MMKYMHIPPFSLLLFHRRGQVILRAPTDQGNIFDIYTHTRNIEIRKNGGPLPIIYLYTFLPVWVSKWMHTQNVTKRGKRGEGVVRWREREREKFLWLSLFIIPKMKVRKRPPLLFEIPPSGSQYFLMVINIFWLLLARSLSWSDDVTRDAALQPKYLWRRRREKKNFLLLLFFWALCDFYGRPGPPYRLLLLLYKYTLVFYFVGEERKINVNITRFSPPDNNKLGLFKSGINVGLLFIYLYREGEESARRAIWKCSSPIWFTMQYGSFVLLSLLSMPSWKLECFIIFFFFFFSSPLIHRSS